MVNRSFLLLTIVLGLIFKTNGTTLTILVTPNVVGATNTSLQFTVSNLNITIPDQSLFQVTFGSGSSINGESFALFFVNQSSAKIEAVTPNSIWISGFGAINSSPIYFQIQSQNGAYISFLQNTTFLSLGIFGPDGNQVDFMNCTPLIFPALLAVNTSTVTGTSRPQLDLALSINSSVILPSNFKLILIIPYLDNLNTLPLIDTLGACSLVNIPVSEAQPIVCSQISSTQIQISHSFQQSVPPGTSLQYQLGPITTPYKVGALYTAQIYLQTYDGGTITDGNSTISTSDSLTIENIGITSTSTQVGTITNLTLTFQLSWILPANATLILTFQSVQGNWISISQVMFNSASSNQNLNFAVENFEVAVYSLCNLTLNSSTFILTFIQFINPPSIGLLNSFNASIISSDGYTIYNYNGSLALPITAGKISSFNFNSTSFAPGQTTNITLSYQYVTSISQGTVEIFLPLGMGCTPFTGCQTLPASDISCSVDCNSNVVSFSVFRITSESNQTILLHDLSNPNSTSSQISFGLSTYYELNQNLYLADILDPPVIYSSSNGNLRLVSVVPSSYTAGENCMVDLYMISDVSLDSNTTLVLEFSETLSFTPNINVTITLFETGYTTNLNITLLKTMLELTNMPLLPYDQIFILHLSNVTLPRSVGTDGYINISSYNNTYSLTNMMMSVTAGIQAEYPNQIEIAGVSIGEQRTDSTLPITFNISLSSSFIPFSDYLEFTYPPEVYWDTSKSYFTSENNPTPYFVGFYPQNRTVRATLKSSVEQNECFEISLLIVSNNSDGQIGAFQISFYDQLNCLIGESPAVYPINWNTPTTFQNVMVSLSNTIVSNLTNCTLQVPLSLQVPIGGSLIVDFPSQLSTTSSACQVSSNGVSLTCLNMQNGTFVITSDSSPILASIQIEIFVINVTTPLTAGPTVIEFGFQTWGVHNSYSLQEGIQDYNITFNEDPTALVVSTSYSGSSHWFPVLIIYCVTVVCLAILQLLVLKKYHITPVIISLWSIAEFPCLVYSIYYFTKIELPKNIEDDFPTTDVTIVVVILAAGIITHIRGIANFKKKFNSNSKLSTSTKIMKFLWVCAIMINSKLLWILFRESHLKGYRTKTDHQNRIFLPGSKFICEIRTSIIWLSICGLFMLTKAIIDSVYHRNGYYFLFEAAAFYIISAVLILLFYRKLGQRHDAYLTSSHNVDEYIEPKTVDNPHMQRDHELPRKQKFEVNQEAEIPHALSGSRIVLDINSPVEDHSDQFSMIHDSGSVKIEGKNDINNKAEAQTPQKPNDPKMVSAGNQEGNNSDQKQPQPRIRAPKEQKGLDSPYQDLMKNLFAINSHYSKYP